MKHGATTQNGNIGEELGKQPAAKYTRAYWFARVYRPEYGRSGERKQVAEWYARMAFGGVRKEVPLGTNDRKEAAQRAVRLSQRVKAVGWDAALAEFQPGRAAAAAMAACPTVGQLLEAYAAAADVARRTARDNIKAFRRLVGAALDIPNESARARGERATWCKRIDAIRLAVVRPEKIQAAINARIAAARGNPLAEQRARTTARSCLKMAKSVLCKNVPLPFRDLPNPFDGVRVKVGTPRKYVSVIDHSALLRDAKAELADQDPEAFKALLLALGAGLRRKEIDTLQWQQIDTEASVIRVETTEAFDPKTDNSAGEVFVDSGLIAELNRFRAPPGDFVMRSHREPRPDHPFCYYRAQATFERLNLWLRAKGVTAQKPLHELRKEFGSVVCAAADIHTASRQLRHAGIAVTAAYYADHRRRVAPAIGAILTPVRAA